MSQLIENKALRMVEEMMDEHEYGKIFNNMCFFASNTTAIELGKRSINYFLQ